MKTTPEVLMVDDNPADIDLTREVLAESEREFHLNVAMDGVEAMALLRREGKYAQAPATNLVILDLNLPRKDGREVLSELRADSILARIPVVIFTTSRANSDITRSYELGANCYLTKPGNLPDFVAAVHCMADFWLGFASLPQKEQQ